jgi:predicted DNA repair protein MutK
MPRFLAALTVVGTAAMLWVGGGILVHGLAHYGIDSIEHALHAAGEAVGGGLPGWAAGAAGSGVLGLAVGFALIPAVGRAAALFGKG